MVLGPWAPFLSSICFYLASFSSLAPHIPLHTPVFSRVPVHSVQGWAFRIKNNKETIWFCLVLCLLYLLPSIRIHGSNPLQGLQYHLFHVTAALSNMKAVIKFPNSHHHMISHVTKNSIRIFHARSWDSEFENLHRWFFWSDKSRKCSLKWIVQLVSCSKTLEGITYTEILSWVWGCPTISTLRLGFPTILPFQDYLD